MQSCCTRSSILPRHFGCTCQWTSLSIFGTFRHLSRGRGIRSLATYPRTMVMNRVKLAFGHCDLPWDDAARKLVGPLI